MNIGGMGTLELIIVFLVAFIFLGPQRMADAAKFLGKLARDVRRMTAELPELVLEEDDKRAGNRPIVHRGGGPEPTQTARPGEESQPNQAQQEPAVQDGPVAFRPASAPTTREEDAEAPPTEERP